MFFGVIKYIEKPLEKNSDFSLPLINPVIDNDVRIAAIVSLPKETFLHRRTLLLDALLNDYFAERVLERRKQKFLLGLSSQILDEILRILFCPKRSRELREQNLSGELPLARAIRFIESNLFAELDSKSIARSIHLSVPTLFRKFAGDLGMTPREYIIKRRLEEASRLVKLGEHSVSDVAILVGYEDVAAFSKAFKRNFGVPPSDWRN